jgi:5-methylcytosine-specific restriction endonuclease McrA
MSELMRGNDMIEDDFESQDGSRAVGPWTVEWCSMGEQKGKFHVDTLRSVVRKNSRTFMGEHEPRYVSPWILMGVFPTAMEASQYCQFLHSIQEKKPVGWEQDDDRIFIPATEDPERLIQLRYMPYRTYLETDHWQTIRQYALKYAKKRCQVCNGNGLVDVHHRTYENRGEERFSDVIVLCRRCHDLFHQVGRLADLAREER